MTVTSVDEVFGTHSASSSAIIPASPGPVRSGGSSQAAALISADRILPVLDGFDEIHPALHRAALHQLNTVTHLPMAITSCPQEYAAAVTGADVLTVAAVIELADLTLDDLDAYLPRTATGKRAGLWDPVLTRMRHHPDSPAPAVLRHVLSNPLMVFLARTVYSDTPHHDPAELLDTARFATSDALQDHLLAAFVPAVYQHHRPGTRRWAPDRVHHYLAYLAAHLDRASTPDLAWWQLRDTIPRLQRVLVLIFAFAVAGMIPFLLLAANELRFAVGLAAGMAAVFPASMVFGLATGLTSVAMFGLDVSTSGRPGNAVLLTGVRASGLTLGRWLGLDNMGPPPERSHLQIHGRAKHVFGWLAVGLAGGISGGLAAGIAGELLFGRGFGLSGSLVIGVAGGLAGGLAVGLEAPTTSAEGISAAESLAARQRPGPAVRASRKSRTARVSIHAGRIGVSHALEPEVSTACNAVHALRNERFGQFNREHDPRAAAGRIREGSARIAD